DMYLAEDISFELYYFVGEDIKTPISLLQHYDADTDNDFLRKIIMNNNVILLSEEATILYTSEYLNKRYFELSPLKTISNKKFIINYDSFTDNNETLELIFKAFSQMESTPYIYSEKYTSSEAVSLFGCTNTYGIKISENMIFSSEQWYVIGATIDERTILIDFSSKFDMLKSIQSKLLISESVINKMSFVREHDQWRIDCEGIDDNRSDNRYTRECSGKFIRHFESDIIRTKTVDLNDIFPGAVIFDE
ncbi:MAG: hypothetical protein ACRC5M_07000, partial [Anaeroplasmataceae bacterium]